MIKKALHKLLKPRHYWRDFGFEELNEIYVSVFFRSLSISLSGLFIPIYVYRLGYSLSATLSVVAFYFTFRIVADFLAAFTVARIGPKHTILIGNVLQIITLVLFAMLVKTSMPLWLLGGLWGMSASFYFIPFHVDFSKVKHKKHAGKEFGYVNVMDKVGEALGPLVGGIIATIYGAQYSLILAGLFLLLSSIALLRTDEPVRTKQTLRFRALNISKIKRDLFAQVALGAENTISVVLWPLYLGLFVVTTNAIYAKVGVLVTISFVVGVTTAVVVGKAIDDKTGRKLLRVSAIINAVTHLVRPFVKTFGAAIIVNVINQLVTVGYRMPFVVGVYAAADDLPGFRIVYITVMEVVACIGKATLWWMLAILSTTLSAYSVMVIGFVVAAVASMLIMTERFKALNGQQSAKAYNE